MSEAYTLRENASLQPYNTFRVAARTAWLASVSAAEAVPAVLGSPPGSSLPHLVLGQGSNVLFTGDFAGLVLRPGFASLGLLEQDRDGGLLRAEAGLLWDEMVERTLALGFAGLENLALIPGFVGAAPIQNIGAYGVEVSEFIECVEAWDRSAGSFRRLLRADCGFGYRDSVFRREPARWVVTAVEFRLPRRHAPRLDYPGLREELAAGGPAVPGPRAVAEAVRRLRRRKLPDPAAVGNAGSFFKNPVVAESLAGRLRAENPAMPVFPAAPGLRKLSAAWLIEACGWRGYREGDAGISRQHALVLVNHGAATGRELLGLARRVAASVSERFTVRLEPEPRIVGEEF
jgi:UDP-N-acetylmuramate dehydrogenase